MLLLDLAVPRDIAPDVAELKDAYLYTVDDLERSVEDNRRNRREAAEAAEAIVELQVARFSETQAISHLTGPLRRLRAHGESAREDVLERARRQLAAGQDPEQVIERLAHTLTNRLLHAPTAAVRETARSGNLELAHALDRILTSERTRDASDPAP